MKPRMSAASKVAGVPVYGKTEKLTQGGLARVTLTLRNGEERSIPRSISTLAETQ